MIRLLVTLLGLLVTSAVCFGPCEALSPLCFDAECPGKRVTDETGCVWDGCAELTGNKIPCWYTNPQYETSSGRLENWFSLVGEKSDKIAYIRMVNETDMYPHGPLYVYDLETQEHRLISEAGSFCMNPKGDGNRLAWIEITKLGDVAEHAIAIVNVLDLGTGEQWQVPNPLDRDVENFSFSDDKIVITEMSYYFCNEVDRTVRRENWLYDLGTGEKTILSGPVLGESRVNSARLIGSQAVYWRRGGFCGGDVGNELWLFDLETGQERMLDEIGTLSPMDSYRYNHSFQFDGTWVAYLISESMKLITINVDTGQRTEQLSCSLGDCQHFLNDGILVYELNDVDKICRDQSYLRISSG